MSMSRGKSVFFGVSLVKILLSSLVQASASVRVAVDRGAQRMHVYVNGQLQHSWKVSTGRGRFVTPTGRFRPTRLERSWYSRKYNNAPMPYSIFFLGGYAIHGTYHVRELGRRASRGCVRLRTGHAAQLFSLVQRYGSRQTQIHIN